MKTAEKRAQIEAAGQKWPVCSCHNVDKVWVASNTRETGGSWGCRITKRKCAIAHNKTPKGRLSQRSDRLKNQTRRQAEARERARQEGRCLVCLSNPRRPDAIRCVRCSEYRRTNESLATYYGLPISLIRELNLPAPRRDECKS